MHHIASSEARNSAANRSSRKQEAKNWAEALMRKTHETEPVKFPVSTANSEPKVGLCFDWDTVSSEFGHSRGFSDACFCRHRWMWEFAMHQRWDVWGPSECLQLSLSVRLWRPKLSTGWVGLQELSNLHTSQFCAHLECVTRGCNWKGVMKPLWNLQKTFILTCLFFSESPFWYFVELDECASYPCLNGATCLDLNDRYECLCADGFMGVNCQAGELVEHCTFEFLFQSLIRFDTRQLWESTIRFSLHRLCIWAQQTRICWLTNHYLPFPHWLHD